jgi:hypothetical protein
MALERMVPELLARKEDLPVRTVYACPGRRSVAGIPPLVLNPQLINTWWLCAVHCWWRFSALRRNWWDSAYRDSEFVLLTPTSLDTALNLYFGIIGLTLMITATVQM